MPKFRKFLAFQTKYQTKPPNKIIETPNLSMLNVPVPFYIVLSFFLTTIMTLYIFLFAIQKTKTKLVSMILVGLLIWLFLQAYSSPIRVFISQKDPDFNPTKYHKYAIQLFNQYYQ